MAISWVVRHGLGLIDTKKLCHSILGTGQSIVWHLDVLKDESAFLGKLWVVDIVIVSKELEFLCQKGLDIETRFREGDDGGLGGGAVGFVEEKLGAC